MIQPGIFGGCTCDIPGVIPSMVILHIAGQNSEVSAHGPLTVRKPLDLLWLQEEAMEA
jgi:hypothetical protein